MNGKFYSVVCTVHIYQVIVYKLVQHCALTNSHTKFLHVSVTATTIIRVDNTTDQNTPLVDGVLSSQAHIAIFRVPFQHRAVLCQWHQQECVEGGHET